MIDENLSPEAKQILALAQQESENLQHFYLGVEHIFIALTKVENGVTQSALQQTNLDPKQVRDTIRRFVGTGERPQVLGGNKTHPSLRGSPEASKRGGEDE